MADQNGLPGLLAAVQSGMQSPLFQQGLGTYNAGASGTNWAGGLMAGQKQNQDYQKTQLEQRQAQQRDAYMRNIDPNDPQFKGLPPGLLGLAKGTGDPSILSNAYAKKLDLDAAMKQAVAMGNIQLQQHIAQLKAQNEMELQQIPARLKAVQQFRNQGQPGGLLSPPDPSGVRDWNPGGQ